MKNLSYTGKLFEGSGNGAAFTRLDWAREQFISKLGIDPYPGTLNIRLDPEDYHSLWEKLESGQHYIIDSPHPENCNARCYPIRVSERFPAAIIYPEVPGYPDDQIEVVAAISIRGSLSLNDGGPISFCSAPPLSINAVLFDVDGTLVDSIGAFFELARLTCAEFELAISANAIYDALNQGGSFWEAALPDEMPERQVMMKKLTDKAKGMWLEVMKEHGSVFPGIAETLNELKANSIKLGIVTNAWGPSLEMLQESGVYELFDAVVTGKDVDNRKPHPEGLLKCVDMLNVNPQECIYVGDSPIDIEASNAAGITSIGVLTGVGNSEKLCAAGTYRVLSGQENLREVLKFRVTE